MIVDVYFNRTRKCWSIRAGGRVIEHAASLTLVDCVMKVSEAGRRRVIQTGKRTVHAWITGTLALDELPQRALSEVVYSPFREGGFQTKWDGRPVRFAAVAHFQSAGRCFVAIALEPYA